MKAAAAADHHLPVWDSQVVWMWPEPWHLMKPLAWLARPRVALKPETPVEGKNPWT